MASCQEYHIDSQPELPPTVKTDALDEYSIAATSPSRIVFNISANTPWAIETDSQWCMPQPAMSAASSLVSEIVILPDDNDTYESRIATLTITSDEVGIVKTIKVIQVKMKELIVFEPVGEDLNDNQITAGIGMACDTIVTFNSNKPWSVMATETPSWLKLEKIDQMSLKVSVVEDNTMLYERSALVKFLVQGTEEMFEFPYRIVQPSPFIIAEGAVITQEPVTGYSKVEFTKGEMFRTAYTIKKGRTIIELADMKMSDIYNLGFNFTAKSSANYKLHMESGNTYWFRCAGNFGWVSPIKKTYTLEEVNGIRKLEFVVEDDPQAEGKLQISIYINDELYGSQTGRTDIFATGDPGCHFIFEAGLDPTPGDYCIFKSITYISE